MPLEHLTGEGTATAGGTGAASGPAHLGGAGAASAAGAASVARRRRMPDGEGSATASGSGTLHYDLHLEGDGSAQSYGYGWLTWPSVGTSHDAIQDAWFYGLTTHKSMLGSGEARGLGLGEL